MASEIELAWAAGFFDGEGSVSVGTDRRAGTAVSIALTVVQSGPADQPPASLVRFLEAVGGMGHIRPRKADSSRLGKKPLWAWRASKIDDAKLVARMLLPYMTEKRDAVASALALRVEWEGLFEDYKRFCSRGHEYTRENTAYVNYRSPSRVCRECSRENTAKHRATRRAQLSSAGVGTGGG